MNSYLLLFSLLISPGSVPGASVPMTLNDCIVYALDHSPELDRLEISYDNQKLNTLIERARFAFNLTAVDDYSIRDDVHDQSLILSREILGGFTLSSALNSTQGRGEDFSSVTVALSKAILGGGTILDTRKEIDDSLVDETIHFNEIGKNRRGLAFRIRSDFYQVVRNIQTLKVQELRLEQAKKNLENALVREKPLDIAQAQVEVPENEVAVLNVKSNIETALDRLKVDMGLMPQQDLRLDETIEFKKDIIDVTRSIEFAYENHEDLLNSGLMLRKLERHEKIYRWRRWPDLEVFTSYNRELERVADSGDRDDVNIGVAFSWELGLGSDRARLAQARNNVEDQKLAIYILQQDKAREIRNLARRLVEAEKSIDLQEERVRHAERLVELYADRWENGEIDILEYIRSQNDRERSKVDLINLKTSYMELLADYRFAVGYE